MKRLGAPRYVPLMFTFDAARPDTHSLPPGLFATAESGERLALALYSSQVPAGFPSPADDHLEGRLDPTALLVRRPAATFFCRADGNSMDGVGIHDGDLLVVDRSIPPQPGDIVVATLDGGLTVKMLAGGGNGWRLEPANPSFPSFAIDPEQGVQIWGVVTFSITPHCQR